MNIPIRSIRGILNMVPMQISSMEKFCILMML